MSDPNEPATGRPGMVRPGAVAAGVAVAGVVWAVARAVVGDLRQPGFGETPASDLGLVMVVVASLLGGLVAWGLLAVLERRGASHARRTWLTVSVVALALSLSGPFSGGGITFGNRMALVAMHVAVAAVVLPVLYHSGARVRSVR